MWKLLDWMRLQSPAARQRYALLVAIGVTTLVGGVWTFSLPTRFVAVTDEVAQTASAGDAPFAGIRGIVSDRWRALWQSNDPTATTSVASTTASTVLPDAWTLVVPASTSSLAAPAAEPVAAVVPTVLIATTSATITP